MFAMTFLLLKKCIEKKTLPRAQFKKKINSKPIGAIAENIDWLFLGNGLDISTICLPEKTN